MSGRGRVLDALLASIAGDLAQWPCLDLTVDGVGATALAMRGLGCDVESRANMGYGLVICEHTDLARGMSSLDPHGSMLAFYGRGEGTEAIAAEYHIVARVRSSEGEWRLLRRRNEVVSIAVSLVVTVQDQARELADLVAALIELDGEPAWELVVIDCGSLDATGELLRNIDGDIQAFRAPRDINRTHATYLGLLEARGELIAVLEPDVIPGAGLVAGLLRGAEQHPDADVFAGPVSGDAPYMLAVRRSIVQVDGDRSPDALALRLRAASPTLVPAFAARRV